MKKENKISPYFTTINVSQPPPPQHPNNNEVMEGSFGEKAIKVSQALLAWLVLILISPFLLLLFGTLLIWKWGVVWVVVKLFKRKFLRGFTSCEGVFAVDHFWESSRSSLGLIVELEGTVDVEAFREEFRKNVLEFSPNSKEHESETTVASADTETVPQQPEENEPEAESSTPPADTPSLPAPVSHSPDRPFAKLAQIPVTFCGYYYWQKANYFLIHEHIRQINQPTDELGLKKAASTLMSLPFPNRRPLWEILVYPNYLGTTTVGRGTTCGSALFIRIHHAVADSKGLMNILQKMMTSSTDTSLQSIKVLTDPLPTSSSSEQIEQPEATVEAKRVSIGGVCNQILNKFTSFVFLPLKTFQFTYEVIRVPDGIANLMEEEQSDSSNASWVPISDSLIRKVCSSQSELSSVTRSVVEMSIFLEGITSRGKHKCLNVSDEKETPTQQGKCQTCVLIPVPITEEKAGDKLLSNTRSFFTVKSSCVGSLQNKTVLLKSIHSQFQRNGVESVSHRQVVKICLRLLSLLPRHILRYLIMSKRWGAGCFIYEQFQMDNSKEGHDDSDKDDKKLFGNYRISQIVPLVGLQWTHTLASAATLQWQDGTVVMSLIANASILGPVSQGNPQDHAERIVKGFPEELERLSDDAEDHGFVSIPIS